MLEKIGYYLTLATVTLLPLVVVPVVMYPFLFGKTLFLMGGVMLAAVCFISALATSSAFRTRTVQILRHPLVFASLALFILDTVLSLGGVDYDRSFLGDEERGMGVLQLAFMYAAFVMLAVYTSTATRKKIVVRVTLGVSICVAMIALLRYTGFLLFGVDTGFRISGTIANAIFFSHAFLWYTTLALFAVVNPHESKWYRHTALLVLVLSLVMIVLAKTRGSLVGLVGGMVVGGTYALYYYRAGARIVKYGLGVLAIFLVGTFAFIRFAPENDLGRLAQFSLSETTFQTRLFAWQAGFDAFKARPLIGWGLENFAIGFDYHYNPRLLNFGFNETRFDRAHNVVVERLVTTGAIGTLAWIAMWLWILVAIHRAPHLTRLQKATLIGGIFAHLGHLLFAFDLATSMMLWFTALTVALPPHEHEVSGETSRRTLFIITPLFVLAITGIWFLIINPVRVNRYFLQGLIVNSEGKYAQTLISYEHALRIPSPYFEELRQEYIVTAGRILEATNDPATIWLRERALGLVRELVDRHPQVSYNHAFEGSVYLRAGTIDPTFYTLADAAYLRATELSPRRQEYRLQRARIALLENRLDDAEALYEEAARLAPEVKLTEWYRGLIRIAQDDEEGAKKILVPLSQAGYVPSFVDEWQLIGAKMGSWGEFKSAARYYFIGVKKYSGDQKMLTQYAAAAIRAGFYRETYEVVTRALALDSAFKPTYDLFMQALPKDAATQPFSDYEAKEFFERNPN